MGAFSGKWQAEKHNGCEFYCTSVAPAHQASCQQIRSASTPQLHPVQFFLYKPQKKYNSSAFKLLLPCRIFLGCLMLETTSAPVCFQKGEPSRSSWLSVRTHADVHETLSPSASVCLGPRPWLIMAHYCSPSPVLFTVDWLFVDFSHILFCWESLHSGYFWLCH